MAKKKAVKGKKDSDFSFDISKIAKEVDGFVLDDMDTVSQWIDTGVLALNFISSGKFIGGGIPGGRLIELYGDSASGKSLFGMNILKGCQDMGGVPILLDVEHAVSKEFAKAASKIDTKNLIVIEPDTLSKCFNSIINISKKIRDAGLPMDRPIVMVYDSIAASPSDREFAETQVDMTTASAAEIKKAGAGVDQPGDRAKICSKYLRLLPDVLKKYNATLIIVNQIRTKIGVMFGDPNTTAGGGKALEFYATSRFKLRSSKVPKDKLGNILGTKVSVNNTKNRCTDPFQEAKDMYLFFKQGINPFGGLLELFLKQGRITSPSNGNFVVSEPWAAGQEIKFKSSKERNDVPYEVLLECPKLVDAEKPEQVQYYVDLFKEAIDITNNGIAEEVDARNVLE